MNDGKYVYLVTHLKEGSEDIDDYKVIGIFSSEELAEKAIYMLSEEPGFVEHRDGFNTAKHLIDRINWKGGFLSGFDAIVED